MRPFRCLEPQRRAALVGCALLAVVVAAPLAARAQGSLRMDLLAHISEGSGRGYAACWGYTAPDGTELALIATLIGTEFYDVTNPARPVDVGFVRGPTSSWRELQTWSHYAYIVSEGVEPGLRGMQIVDLANPQQPRLVGAFDGSFTKAHTIHIAAGFAYINGSDNGWRILDLADPEHPRDVGGWGVRYVHDCFVRGDRAYLANINNGGFTILDVSNKALPQEIGFTSYLGAATHNCWTTDDGDYLFTTDETGGGHLRVWDVRNPARATQVGDWSADGAASIHNVVVKGDSAYVAYYTEGVHVLDVSQPTTPRPVGYYDTYPGVSGGYNGAWGVYPFARNGRIYVSDIQGGLFVLEMNEEGDPPTDFLVEPPQSQIVVPGQSQLLLFFDIYNNSGGNRRFGLTATSSVGWPVDVQPFLDVPNTSIEAVMLTVHVPTGITTPVRADVELCATQQMSGVTRCARTRIAVPVVLRSFAAEAVGDGVALRWQLDRDAGDRGRLEVQRARVVEPGAPATTFEWRAGLDLAAGGWLDRDVEPGAEYVYRLLLLADGGTHVLGETRIALTAPARSRLLGATPNPFNPTTRIRFELGRAGPVAITIHDARGRLVRHLQAANLGAGEHALVWDGRDVRGTPEPSGLYLYEVRSGAWTAHGRMTLAK